VKKRLKMANAKQADFSKKKQVLARGKMVQAGIIIEAFGTKTM